MKNPTRRAAATLLAAAALTACAAPPPPATNTRTTTDTTTPNTSPILSTTEWTFITEPGKLIRTPHYRIYTTSRNPVLLDRVAPFLEHALRHYRAAALTPGAPPLPLPRQTLDTYFMHARPQWESLTTRILGEQRDAALNIARGGFATRGLGVYYDIGLYDTLALAAHEGWHQYTQRTFKHPLPTLLEEGIAAYMEGHAWRNTQPVFTPWNNLNRFDHLRTAAAENTLFTLDELAEASPADLARYADNRILTFYAQAWAFAHFLKQHHPHALEDILRDAAAGHITTTLQQAGLTRREAFQTVSRRASLAVPTAYINRHTARTPAQLADDFAHFQQRLVATGARNDITNNTPPSTLSD